MIYSMIVDLHVHLSAHFCWHSPAARQTWYFGENWMKNIMYVRIPFVSYGKNKKKQLFSFWSIFFDLFGTAYLEQYFIVDQEKSFGMKTDSLMFELHCNWFNLFIEIYAWEYFVIWNNSNQLPVKQFFCHTK